MNSLVTDICTAIGAMGLLAFALLSALRIHQSRKSRDRSRKLAARILTWKSPD